MGKESLTRFLVNKEVLASWADDRTRIIAFRKVWENKRVLRKIYYDKWKQMLSFARKGKILEIGSGPGYFKNFCPRSIMLDIVPNPWIDVVADGCKLPFKSESLSNIMFVDVLHHVHDPLGFMKEIERTLKKGGRLIFEEPLVSKASYFVYRIHHEGLNMKPHLKNYMQDSGKKPLEADLATPTLIFCKYFHETKKLFPRLKLIHMNKQDCFFLCLYGNFTYKQVIPTFLYKPLKFLEKSLGPLRKLLAFKILIVMEKV